MEWEKVRQALVLINSEPGAEATVLKALEAIPEVKETHMIYGVYSRAASLLNNATFIDLNASQCVSGAKNS